MRCHSATYYLRTWRRCCHSQPWPTSTLLMVDGAVGRRSSAQQQGWVGTGVGAAWSLYISDFVLSGAITTLDSYIAWRGRCREVADVAALGLLDSVIVYELSQGITARCNGAVRVVEVSDDVLSSLLQPHHCQPQIPILPPCEGHGPGGGDQPLMIAALTYILHVSLQEGRGNITSQDTRHCPHLPWQ